MSDRSLASAPSVVPIKLGPRGRFGRYELCAELASGGMGTVYAARALGPGGYEQLVALKLIHAHLAKDPKFVAMFLDEARIAARITHPNVCGVTDFGEVDGVHFLAMPFVLGHSLSKLRRAAKSIEDTELRARFPFVAARLIADACEGLHAAHELRDDRGVSLEVVHRDVSPSNLLVGFDGACRVIDFGVASARERLHRTVTGEVKGKLSYAAPEQLDSKNTLDRRADVWALGVVAWECFAGSRLFSRDGMAETVLAVSTAPIPSIREHWAEAPIAFEEVVFEALNRDPERRFPTARAFGRALQAALADAGEVMTTADVAEWMERVFPGGEREMRALVERPSVAVAETVISSASASTSAATEETSAVVEVEVEGARTSERPTVAGARVSKEREDRPARAGKTSRWAVGLVVVALGGGSAWWWTGASRETDAAETESVTETETAPVTETDYEVAPASSTSAPGRRGPQPSAE